MILWRSGKSEAQFARCGAAYLEEKHFQYVLYKYEIALFSAVVEFMMGYCGALNRNLFVRPRRMHRVEDIAVVIRSGFIFWANNIYRISHGTFNFGSKLFHALFI